jgi:hypothetical protein
MRSPAARRIIPGIVEMQGDATYILYLYMPEIPWELVRWDVSVL